MIRWKVLKHRNFCKQVFKYTYDLITDVELQMDIISYKESFDEVMNKLFWEKNLNYKEFGKDV